MNALDQVSSKHRAAIPLLILVVALMGGCAADAAYATQAPDEPLPASVPALPFADNPDPTLCGIPEPFGNEDPGLVTGKHEGALIQPIVYLYDSHLRQSVTGQLFPNSRVRILLSQSNPELDYYFVESFDIEPVQRGWIPAPFLKLPGEF